MTRGLVLAFCLCAAVTLAQGRPAFEVASIRPSADQVTQVSAGARVTGSQVRIVAMSVKDYVGVAYRIRASQISGPEWLAQQRFDITATLPENVSPDQVPEMFQSLLADRFAMKVHRETKEFPVYALTIAKTGLKVKELPPDPAPDPNAKPQAFEVAATGSGNGVDVNLGGGSSFSLGNNRLEVKKITVTALADLLSRFVDRPVVDMTSLKGRYDVTLEIAPEDYTPMMIRSAVNAGISLPSQALRMLEGASPDPLSAPLRQVGLALESRRAPLDVVVVDSALRTPTEN